MSQVKPFSHILVALDFSPHSRVVLKQARLLSQNLGLPLVLFHAIDNSHVSATVPPSLFEKIESEVLSKFRSVYRVQRGERVVIADGRPFEQILLVARKLRNPLIFVGHKTTSVIDRLLVGSTTEKLIHNAKFPVWVHKSAKVHTPKKIMIASDFSRRTTKSLQTVLKLGLKKPQIELLHVLQPIVPLLDYSAWQVVTAEMETANKKSIARLKQTVAPYPVIESVSLDVARELVKKSRKYDLSVIASYSESKLFGGLDRNSTKLLRESPSSLLILPT